MIPPERFYLFLPNWGILIFLKKKRLLSSYQVRKTRSTIEGGEECNNFVPVLRGNGTKIAPTGDIFDQPPGGMSWIRGKLADHVGDHHVVLSPEKGVLVTSPGTESSYPRLPQALNNSKRQDKLIFASKTLMMCTYISSTRTVSGPEFA